MTLPKSFRAWIDERRPSLCVPKWRKYGRKWALMGNRERSEACHALADCLERGFWYCILTGEHAKAIRRIEAFRRVDRETRKNA